MIVFVDPDKQEATVCDTTVHVVPFTDMQTLSALLINQPDVIYVTGATLTNGTDILNFIAGMTTGDIVETGRQYIRSTGRGFLNITDIGLQFSGPYDLKPMEKFGSDIFERSGIMKKLLEQGKLEVVGERKAKELREAKKKQIAPKDRSLDSIIMTTDQSALSMLDSNSMFKDDDKDTLVVNGNDPDPLSEEQQIINELNIIKK